MSVDAKQAALEAYLDHTNPPGHRLEVTYLDGDQFSVVDSSRPYAKGATFYSVMSEEERNRPKYLRVFRPSAKYAQETIGKETYWIALPEDETQ